MVIHPLLWAAAAGKLPGWARVSPERRAHVERVSELMGDWAAERSLDEETAGRWRAAGLLHDVLRDADPEELRCRVPPGLADLPGLVLHGPAGAERLRLEGVDDGAFLRAVAYHTLGHPDFGVLGRALYAADFLEPGRAFRDGWRAELRARARGALDPVVREIVAARITHQMGRPGRLRRETVAFWNVLVAEG